MQHAHRPSHAAHGGSRRLTLPALLLTLGGGAFAGLAAQAAAAPAAQVAPPDATQLAASGRTLRLAGNEAPRASRSRLSEGDRASSTLGPSTGPSPSDSPSPSPVPPPPPVTAPLAPVIAMLPPLPVLKPKPAPSGSKPAPPAVRISGSCPVPAARFTDTFGAPRGGGRRHQGTDMMASDGTPVYAVATGVVRTSSGGDGGISLSLRATDGSDYYYAHNAANLVRSGSRVEAGDLIAKVGSSGNASASAPHVHFEQKLPSGATINSYPLLRRICG